jgi:hypothetical protein
MHANENLRQNLMPSCRGIASSDDRLRFLLLIEDPELRTKRSERLSAPLDHSLDFLALNQRGPFFFYLPSLTNQHFL